MSIPSGAVVNINNLDLELYGNLLKGVDTDVCLSLMNSKLPSEFKIIAG